MARSIETRREGTRALYVGFSSLKVTADDSTKGSKGGKICITYLRLLAIDGAGEVTSTLDIEQYAIAKVIWRCRLGAVEDGAREAKSLGAGLERGSAT